MKLLNFFLFFAVVVNSVVLVLDDSGLFNYLKLQQRITVLFEENETLKQRNHLVLLRLQNLKNNKDYIEEYARKELGMIGKNETLYVVKSKKKVGSEL